MDWLTLIVIGVITLLLWLLYKCERGGPYNVMKDFPGPPMPFIAHRIPSDPKESTDYMMDLIEKYGSGARVKVATIYSIFLSSAEHFEAVLTDRDNITKGFWYGFAEPWLGKGLVTSTNDRWHRHRKLLTPTFHFKILTEYVPVMNQAATILTEKLSEVAGKDAVPIWPYVTKCALDILCETSMGFKLNSQQLKDQHYFLDAIQKFSDCAVGRLPVPWYWNETIYKWFDHGKRFNEANDTLHDFTAKVMADRDSSFDEKPRAESTNEFGSKTRLAFLDMMLKMNRDGKLSKEEILEQTDTFMFAGQDTTSSALQYLLYCLGRNPEWLHKCQQEIDEVVGDGDVDYATCGQLPILETCIKESARLYSSVPQIARTTTKPLKLDDNLTVPPGITINLLIYALHRDPKVYPNPDVFDPNRFLPDECANRNPFAYLPFSAGLRNCIGQKYAQLEEKILAVHILRKFNVTAPQTPEEMGRVFSFLLRPENDVVIGFNYR